MKEKSVTKAVFHIHTIKTNETSDLYGTPKWLYQYYCNYFQIKPKLDVCASHFIHVCDNYWTKDDDMFTKSCDVDFYMNPPYSKIWESMEWAWKQVSDNKVNALVCVNGNLNAEWFRKFLWEPYRKDSKEGSYGKRVDLDVNPNRVKFLDRFGKIPTYVDKKGRIVENTAMYSTVFAKFVAGSTL